MDTSKLEQWISEKWASDKSKWNEYADDGKGLIRSNPTCVVTTEGTWAWVKLCNEAKWDQDAPWDDYSSWEEVEEEISWLGVASGLPEEASCTALDDWASHKTRYFKSVDKSDSSKTRKHEGDLVEAVDASGAVRLKRAKGVTSDWPMSATGPSVEWGFEDTEVSLG